MFVALVVDGRDAAATAIAQLVFDHFALAFRIVLEAYLVQRLLDALVVIGLVQALVLATCFGAALLTRGRARIPGCLRIHDAPPSAILIEDFAAPYRGGGDRYLRTRGVSAALRQVGARNAARAMMERSPVRR